MDPAWEKLAGKRWGELEVLEHQGRLFFEHAIRRRLKDGKTESVKIRLRVLRKPERREALLEAERWAAEIGIDPAKEHHKPLVDEMDQLCILARAIREHAPPHDQLAFAKDLERQYDDRSLQELWAKYQLCEDQTDPRDENLGEEEFWSVIAALVKARSLAPLAECASRAQNNCIVRMAELSLISPAFRSWFTQYESSTQEPSASTSSAESPAART
jgi:hypothetical protein